MIIFCVYGKTFYMIILYILLIAYILAINFYAFLLVKTLSKQERDAQAYRQAQPLISSTDNETAPPIEPLTTQVNTEKPQKYVGKLCIAGALGGAIAIYVSMFIFKFRLSDLFLMVIMPLLGVLNIYIWVLLFRSGFAFFVIR